MCPCRCDYVLVCVRSCVGPRACICVCVCVCLRAYVCAQSSLCYSCTRTCALTLQGKTVKAQPLEKDFLLNCIYPLELRLTVLYCVYACACVCVSVCACVPVCPCACCARADPRAISAHPSRTLSHSHTPTYRIIHTHTHSLTHTRNTDKAHISDEFVHSFVWRRQGWESF